MSNIQKRMPGILLAAIIAIPAYLIGKAVPVIGSPVLGILFGMLLAFFKRPAILEEGIKYTAKKLLQYSIVLLGFDMNLYRVFQVGGQTLLLMAFTLTASLLTAYIAGRLLKVDSKVTTLIGVGTSICGGSAIAAAAPIIQAEESEVAHAISTIFLFNVIAAFLFPFLGHVMGMNDTSFGLWAGTAINDTSSVVAAGYTYSKAAGDLAVIVKLTRTLMIVPITLFLALVTAKKTNAKSTSTQPKGQWRMLKVFPWFVLYFLAASMLNTFISLPAGVSAFLTQAGKFMIVMAMACIGLNTNLVKLIKSGGRPILLGLGCWVVLSTTSLLVQRLL